VDNLSHVGLYVWGNDVAIGNDNDPTTFGRPEFSSANVLLNCLFYADLRAAAEIAVALKRSADAAALTAKADALGVAMRKLCWDPRDRFFYTVDVQCRDRRAELIPAVPPGMAMSWQSLPLRIEVFTGFMPLWCGVATEKQAGELVRLHYLSDDRFRANYGVRTLSLRETMYSLEAHSGNPSNWLGPVWIIANYLAWKGLQAYGFREPAQELADKTIALLAADLAKSGSLNEYYHPDKGAALSHAGFMDWNMLVLEMM
jgi:putative isomerase